REAFLHRWRLKCLPVSLVREIARVGKGGLRRAASRTEIPADVIGMQMRQEHSVDGLGTYPNGLQLFQQMPICPTRKHGDCARVGDSAPHAGVDQDGASLRPQQEPPEMGTPGIRAW